MSNEELVRLYQEGNQEALLALWDQVRGLAYIICSSYHELLQENAAVDMDDLLQASFLGVEVAARKFDADRAMFSTYVVLHIRKQCRAALGLTGRKRLEHYYKDSLDAPIADDNDSTLHDIISDPEADSIDAPLLADDMAQRVQGRVAALPPAQAEAVARHWLAGETYKQISADMGIPPLKVRRLLQLGLRKLSRDRSLRELAEAYCWRHVSLATFRTTHTSATEQAVLWRLETNERADL